ncbi:hypothetical protein O3M35_007504 [Rhynocoris fuscipes]
MKEIPISAKGRGRISTLLCFLSWTECLLGLILAATSAIPLTMISTYMKDIDLDLDMIFKTQFLCGAQVALASFGGALVSRAVANNPSEMLIKRTYIIWTTFCTILIILVTIILFTLPHAVEAGINELSYIVQRGMRDYLQDYRWKSMLDGIQQHYRCCGHETFEDWFKTNWMPIQSIRTYLRAEKSPVSENGGLLVSILPHSCCKPEVDIPCLHDNLQQNSTFTEWITGGPTTPFRDSVYTTGCLTALKKVIMSGTTSFNFVIVLIIIIQAGVLILTKCLKDSFHRQEVTKAKIKKNKKTFRSFLEKR